MSIITAYKKTPMALNIEPMSIKRDWMDETPQGHAYRCHPVTSANVIGWSISSPVDIKFIWNGINDTSNTTVTILEGQNYVYTGRGQSSVSFNTGFILRTNQDVSVLTITPQNYFNPDIEVMSSLISTSFLNTDFPLAIKCMTANKEITIKAGTPIATIIPISLTSLKDESIEIVDFVHTKEYSDALNAYGAAAQEINKMGEWTDWYRNAVNEKGESVGSHEVKNLKLSVIDSTGVNSENN
jgi:hypothetical protein